MEPERDDLDAWASEFFARLLAGALRPEEFESEVDKRWRSGRFVAHAPNCARWLLGLAQQQGREAGYASGSGLDFRSQWLHGVAGRPGVIHIQAPAERAASDLLREKNREPHLHDSGRIALITRGHAVLHLACRDASGAPQRLDCALREGDLAFWPAWTAHTFDAGDGFWLISAMAEYVSPAEDGFALAPAPNETALDDLPARSYAHHLAGLPTGD